MEFICDGLSYSITGMINKYQNELKEGILARDENYGKLNSQLDSAS